MQVDHRKRRYILRTSRIERSPRKTAIMPRVPLMDHKNDSKDGERRKYDNKNTYDKSLHIIHKLTMDEHLRQNARMTPPPMTTPSLV